MRVGVGVLRCGLVVGVFIDLGEVGDCGVGVDDLGLLFSLPGLGEGVFRTEAYVGLVVFGDTGGDGDRV